MTAPESERSARNWLSMFSELASLLVIGLGILVLIGWALDFRLLTCLAPGCVAMNPMGAVGLVLSGVGLWLAVRREKVPSRSGAALGMALAAVVAVLGATRLAHCLGMLNFQVDQLLFARNLHASGIYPPCEMPPITALGFMLCGLALLLFEVEIGRGFFPAQALILGTGLVSSLGLISYAYRAFSLYRAGSVMPMSLGTSLGLGLWCLAALAARPNRGVMQVITSPATGGAMARRLLPMALLVPAMLGALRLLGEKAGYFETETGVSIFAVGSMLIFAALIWWTAKLLFHTDLERLRTERRLALEYNCTRVLAESQEPGQALPRILQAICESLDWRLGVAWLLERDTNVLNCAGMWHSRTAVIQPFVEETRKISFSMGHGLPGRVWQAAAPVWISDVTKDTNFPRAEAAVRAGLHGAFGFPLRLDSDILGVLEFFSPAVEQADKQLLEMLAIIGSQIGQFIKRQQAEIELRHTSSDLARSNADLQQFAYVASHDLFEPLRMVSSFLQLLRERARGKLDKPSEEFIDFALDGAHRMKALIDDLLAYSRVDIRRRALEPVSCEEVFNTVSVNLKVAIEETGAVITHEPLPTVRGDLVQLTQVIQNLVGNAIKFHGQAAPRIHVSAHQKEGEWVFSVRDNGIGIDPKHFNRIFEIFQRLHTRHEYAGTGMGLAICKRIIERHGGKIWVESTPGKGSTFHFTLPVMSKT